jgi:hypothetical protein
LRDDCFEVMASQLAGVRLTILFYPRIAVVDPKRWRQP